MDSVTVGVTGATYCDDPAGALGVTVGTVAAVAAPSVMPWVGCVVRPGPPVVTSPAKRTWVPGTAPETNPLGASF